MKYLSLSFCMCLWGCNSTSLVPVPEVPLLLTEPVPVPEVPVDGTQKDVALYIVQQHSALEQCNTQLTLIREWSDQW